MDYLKQTKFLKHDSKLVTIFKSRLDKKGDVQSFVYDYSDEQTMKSLQNIQAAMNISSKLPFKFDGELKLNENTESYSFAQYHFEVKFYS